jgi:hypothetical protein
LFLWRSGVDVKRHLKPSGLGMKVTSNSSWFYFGWGEAFIVALRRLANLQTNWGRIGEKAMSSIVMTPKNYVFVALALVVGTLFAAPLWLIWWDKFHPKQEHSFVMEETCRWDDGYSWASVRLLRSFVKRQPSAKGPEEVMVFVEAEIVNTSKDKTLTVSSFEVVGLDRDFEVFKIPLVWESTEIVIPPEDRRKTKSIQSYVPLMMLHGPNALDRLTARAVFKR